MTPSNLCIAVYWPDPESFKPDRFIDTDDYKYNRDAFLPFGGGARACLGRKFAEVEMTGKQLFCCSRSSLHIKKFRLKSVCLLFRRDHNEITVMIATLVAFCRKYCVILPDDMQGPPGESILNKKKRVLANKSMVTLTPLTYPWLLSAVKPLKIIDKQKCFDGKCSGVYHATIYTFCNHNMYGSFTHTSSDLSPGDPLTFYCLCKGMCSFRGKQPLAREMPWQWPMKRLCLVLHL